MIQTYIQMKEDLEKMQCLANSFEAQLRKLPKGSLSMRQGKTRTYYYHNFQEDGKRCKKFLKSSSKRDQMLLHKLQRRRFIEKGLPLLKTNIHVLEAALKNFRPYDPEQIYDALSPAYQTGQKDPLVWLPEEPDLRTWAREPY